MKNVWMLTLATAVMQTLVASAQSSQAPPARAQTPAAVTTTNPTFELSAAYQFLHLPDQNFPFGLNVDGLRHYGSLGAVAEIGWARHGDGDDGIDVATNMWNFGVGGRWTRFGSGRAWPYGQVIIGAAVADAGDTETSFMVQPGVGVTVVSGDGWGVFGQFDYRRTFFDEPDDVEDGVNNHFRVMVGLRMILD